ncbi:hypothetical protein TrRE_jg2895, partial [Triparma retinervis]
MGLDIALESMALGASLSNSKKSVVPRAEMDSERAPNSYSFDAQPVQPVDGDLGDALASKNRLSANLSTGLDGVLQVLESLDDKITSADGDVVGERLLNFLDTTGDSLKAAADYVLNSDDNCESLVDGLLAIESGAPIDEEYEYVKGTLIGLINSSPGVLLDISAAVKSLTLEEAVEISEVGLELSCVGIVLSRFVLEKVDVEGIVDEMYDGGGAGMTNLRNGKVGNPWGGQNSEKMEVEFLDGVEVEEEEGGGGGGGDSNAAGAGARRSRRKLKKLPLVFWPRISKVLLSPFTSSDHPIRHYVANNPKLSFLVSLFLLSPPAVLLSAFLMPPLLVTDEIVHK